MRRESATKPHPPYVVLLGDMEMADALRRGGAQVDVVGTATAPASFSRHRYGWVPDRRPDEVAMVAELVAAGRAARTLTGERGVVCYQTDEALLLVSRHRHQIGPELGLLLPPDDLVQGLVDKAAFAALAVDRGLPVPVTTVVRTCEPSSPVPALPVVVKPVTRDEAWDSRYGGSKAHVARDRCSLDALFHRLQGTHDTVVVQALVPGPESRVESYHVYVDPGGHVVAEFTGVKVRTHPVENGLSTAVMTTDAPDVRALGREVVRALGLVGVAKMDVKRDPRGRLWLLEVNPRFNLWHRLGAAAGVDLPALVVADLTGRPRPPTGPVRPGVLWCHVPRDVLAARASGTSMLSWMASVRRCAVWAGLDPRDPLPYLLGKLAPGVALHARRRCAQHCPGSSAADVGG